MEMVNPTNVASTKICQICTLTISTTKACRVGISMELVNPSNVDIFFFSETATTEIYTAQYTLSLHDALPISGDFSRVAVGLARGRRVHPPRHSGEAQDRKSTRLNSSHIEPSRMPSSA